jgi:methylglutaconyl-CoA hydratase
MKTVSFSKQNHVATIHLNRPDVRNAFHPEMIADLTRIFKSLPLEKDIRVVHLAGQGKSFCSGADLEWMKSMASFSEAENLTDAEKLFEMFESIQHCPYPVVTKVHGHVMGGALGLVAVSDLIVADQDTQFCFSEAKLGLAPAVISAFVKDRLSMSHMNRWFLTAEVFGSAQALEMGLVHSVARGADVDATVKKWTEGLLANGPVAVQATKKLIREVSSTNDNMTLKKITSRLIAQLRAGQEGQEGLKSFFEKRKPSWVEKS